MLSSVVPACRQAGRAASRAVTRRGYCDRPWRRLPVYRSRASQWADFRHHDHPGVRPGNMEAWVAEKMRRMDKMFEEVTPLAKRGFSARTRRDVQVKYDDSMYEVKIPVKDFAAEEISVKVAENKLTVSGKFESKPDDKGIIYQEFTRQFEIPKDVCTESLESLVTEDGNLIIRGQVKSAETPKETPIKIQIQKSAEGGKADTPQES